eukprot:632158-Amphidinium_carterae.1
MPSLSRSKRTRSLGSVTTAWQLLQTDARSCAFQTFGGAHMEAGSDACFGTRSYLATQQDFVTMQLMSLPM